MAMLPLAAIMLDSDSATVQAINSTSPRGALCSDFTVRVTASHLRRS